MIRGEIEKSLALAKQVEHEAEASGWRRLSVLALFHQAEMYSPMASSWIHWWLVELMHISREIRKCDKRSRTVAASQSTGSLGRLRRALEALLAAERYFLEHDEVVLAAQCLLARAAVICQLGRLTKQKTL